MYFLYRLNISVAEIARLRDSVSLFWNLKKKRDKKETSFYFFICFFFEIFEKYLKKVLKFLKKVLKFLKRDIVSFFVSLFWNLKKIFGNTVPNTFFLWFLLVNTYYLLGILLRNWLVRGFYRAKLTYQWKLKFVVANQSNK